MSAREASGTTGTGYLRSGQHNLGTAHYEIHVGIPNRPGLVVELESPPHVQDGGVLQIHVRGASPYCRVVGERPAEERRRPPLPSGAPEERRRRDDGRAPQAINHPCPRCTTTEVLVTHRGVMSTTLCCPVCHHEWREPSSVVAIAARGDRRVAARAESIERRGADRPVPPVCEYCATDAHVRSSRRTSRDVYFVCLTCDAMWALPVSSRQSTVDSR
jgi:hypothetical protein